VVCTVHDTSAFEFGQYSSMTTLAESFLADLDDLSDASDHEQEEQQEEDDTDQVSPSSHICLTAFDLVAYLAWYVQQMAVDDIENLNYDSLEAVAHLRASDRYKEIMQVRCTPVYVV